MLDWNISLRRLLDEALVRQSLANALLHPERKAEFKDGSLEDRMAVWQAGPAGLTWIQQAAAHDGGVALVRDGYPNWYLVRATDAIPVLRGRQPYEAPMYEYPNWIVGEHDVILPTWLGKTDISDEAMNRCGPDDWLLVTAWDES